MTGMQSLLEELRRHADEFERATDPEVKRRALRRFRITFLLGNQSLGAPEPDGHDGPGRLSAGGTLAFRTGAGAARGGSEEATVSRTESEGCSRTTGLADTRAGPDGGSSHSVGRSVSAGGCPDCAHRAREVEERSTARTIGVGRSHGHSITDSKGVSTTPESHTRGENEMSANDHGRNEVSEWLIEFLKAGSDYDATATLREAMDIGTSHAGLRVRDGTGTEHGFGSPLYERLFLDALRQYVAAGEIEPVFADEGQRAGWEAWLTGADVPIIDTPLRFCGTIEPAVPSRSPIDRARAHLLDILGREGKVRYSRFYNANPDPEAELRALFGLEYESDSAAVLMDDAVWDLKQAGLVTTADLPERLMDGESDYLIELTEKGRAAVAESRAARPMTVDE